MKIVIQVLTISLVLSLMACCPPKDGKNGLNGQAGAKGADGTSCSTLAAIDGSGALIQCTDGTSTFISNGKDGLSGTNGTNATPISMIQLCPSITGIYPSSFPEFAFNVNGKLYATYWSGSSAWTAQLYPGSYSSTTNGSNCSFVVNADSTISN